MRCNSMLFMNKNRIRRFVASDAADTLRYNIFTNLSAMNITEVIVLTFDGGLCFAKSSFNLLNLVTSGIYRGTEISDRLLLILISGSNIVTFLILKFFLSFLSIFLIIVLISLCKSLQTKYLFLRRNKDNIKSFKCAFNQVPLSLFKLNTSSLTRLVVEKWIIAYKNAKDECEDALNENDSSEITQKLPWAHTRPDVETLNWLNDTVISFWPSIKSSLNEIVSTRKVFLGEINLGQRPPLINSIDFVSWNNSNYSYGNLLGTAESNITEKDKNLSFALELSYQTDKQFRITLNSVPLLGYISLTKLNIQFRLMLTLNHPTSELNKDLKIFETPDDILWPLVNYFQVTLVDVPLIDWRFERVIGSVGRKGKCRWSTGSENSTSTGGHARRWFSALASRYLNPIRVLNHTYFKYLIHSCLCLGLRWFKPFTFCV